MLKAGEPFADLPCVLKRIAGVEAHGFLVDVWRSGLLASGYVGPSTVVPILRLTARLPAAQPGPCAMVQDIALRKGSSPWPNHSSTSLTRVQDFAEPPLEVHC